MEKDKKEEAEKEDTHPHFVDVNYPKEEPWRTDIYVGPRDGSGSHGHLALSGAATWYFRDIKGPEIVKNGEVIKKTPVQPEVQMRDIKEFENRVILGDCIQVMKEMPSGKIDLIFADPPYNIGIKYDNHNDRMRYEEYILWCREWLKECVRLLSDNGSIYIAIYDEHAAEIVMILKSLGLTMRNWIIWHYTFGQSQRKKFSRGHTHILYFTKNRENFIFNSDDIRVKSIRQEIGDKRANPKGKLPDDVWENGISEEDSIWKISRVAGTFKERIKGFPAQMPVKLLERVIRTSSNKESIVFDPFSGSGTTPYVAKKLGRTFIATEISPKYHKISESRVKSILNV